MGRGLSTDQALQMKEIWPGGRMDIANNNWIPTPQNNYTSGNNPRFSNPQWDALVDRYAVTIPYEERMQVMTNMIAFLMDELMYQPLFFDTLVVPVSNRLLNAGVPRGGQRANQGWNAHTWDVK